MPRIALDLAFDEIDESGRELAADVVGEREAAIRLRRLVRRREQIGRERRAAGGLVVVGGREVVREAVAVQVRRHARDHRLPLRGIGETERARALLFKTAIRIALEPAAHAGQAIGQLRLQRHRDAAAHDAIARRRGVGGRRDRQRERAVDLRERRLLNRHGNRGRHALGQLDVVAGLRAALLDRAQFHVNAADEAAPSASGAVTFHATSCDESAPCSIVCAGRSSVADMRRHDDLHLARRRVAQRELRAERIADPHERRQPGMICSPACGGSTCCRCRTAPRRPRDRDDAKARQRVVQRHVDGCLAVRVEHDARVPQAAACRTVRASRCFRRRRPPAPPCGRNAARPMISICAVDVSTP